MKKNNEKNKTIAKRTLSGILSLTLLISLISNIKYYVERAAVENSVSFSNELELDENERVKNIRELFERSLYKNKKLSEEEKKIIITSFEENFLNHYAKYLDYDSIVDLCVSAQTVDIKLMSDFARKWGWWSGSFNPYSNRYSIADYDGELVSHENLHAILKRGLMSTGLNTLVWGYGLNEGATSLFNNDFAYVEESIVINNLALIIGFEEMLDCYLNGNTFELVNKMCKYTSLTNALKLITLTDINVFSGYYDTFSQKFKEESYEEDYSEQFLNRFSIIRDIVSEMYENKFGKKITDDNLGKYITNSDGFTLGKNNFEFFYTFWFNQDGQINLTAVGTELIETIDENGNENIEIPSKNYVYSIEELQNLNFEDWIDMARNDLNKLEKNGEKILKNF